VYAVFARRGPPPNKVRAFVDFLAERYRQEGILAPEESVSGLPAESHD